MFIIPAILAWALVAIVLAGCFESDNALEG